ncbi:hypothetical protein OIO90_004448 [Microbotryomycetes sp. JL221]|nr:hypothetical protein OIO90_004448 [Microbotryomycetes sp. JL221]
MTAATLNRPDMPIEAQDALLKHQVPLIGLDDACRGCSELDQDDHVDGYPSGFDIDLDSVMLGSVKPYGRQILIATGKSDWEREVTDSGLPSYIKDANERLQSTNKLAGGGGGLFDKLTSKLKRTDSGRTTPKKVYDGVFDSASQLDRRDERTLADTRLSIVSASFQSSSPKDEQQSVIVLPDYKIVQGVAQTKQAAQDLVQSYLDPTIGRTGLEIPAQTANELQSWPLPYSAVVLICSHKRRDKRCHIAAPLLIDQFHRHLSQKDFEVDERGDDIHCPTDDSIESWPADVRNDKFDDALRGVKTNGTGASRVALWKISHIGGHRYAGNVIIYLPNGTSVWYGRVTPKDVGAIVEATIVKGKVIKEFLRGGMGLTGRQDSILSW